MKPTVEYDVALNNAGWKFLDEAVPVTPQLYNNVKRILKGAIEIWLDGRPDVVVLPPQKKLSINIEDENYSLMIDGEEIFRSNHDAIGWVGMDAVTEAVGAIANKLGERVLVVTEPDSEPEDVDDSELLDWAEEHPEVVMKELGNQWATCGKGFREKFFAFRNAIRMAKSKAD